jgi:hypothetical protein
MAKEHLSVEKDGLRLLAPESFEQATAQSEDCSEFLDVDLCYLHRSMCFGQ